MNSFTAPAIFKLFPAATERTYDAGQIIVYNGDRPSYVIFVLSGAYKFYDVDAEGNEKILNIGGPQSFFPLFYPFENKPQVDAFYTTLSKSRFLFIPLEDFRARLKTDAKFTYEIMQWYASEMDHIVLRLKSMEKSTARHKLLQALAYLSEQHSVLRPLKKSRWERVAFPISQQTLAELTGLTRETVNMTLRDLDGLDLVRMPRKMVLEIHRENLTKYLNEE